MTNTPASLFDKERSAVTGLEENGQKNQRSVLRGQGEKSVGGLMEVGMKWGVFPSHVSSDKTAPIIDNETDKCPVT